MSGAKGLPVAAISRRPTQDGDAAVLGRSDELKMKARMRARFWEENDEQTDERVALDHIEGFDQRREEKEKKQTLEKREEERLQRQKQKAENDKERVREVIQREKARRDMRQLQDFLKDNEHSLMGEDEERTKAMKLAAALLFRDFETPRAIVNALHRSNLNLQSQQSIFKFVNQYIVSTNLRNYMENVNDHGKEHGQGIEPWHREANAALSHLEDSIIGYCIKHTRDHKFGPVGETPVHLAFLFGEHKLGKRMITSSARFLAFKDAWKRSGFDVHTHPQGAGGKKIALASRKVLEQKRKRKKTMALVKLWVLPADNCLHSVEDAKAGDDIKRTYHRQTCKTCGASQCAQCAELWRQANKGTVQHCQSCNQKRCRTCGMCTDRQCIQGQLHPIPQRFTRFVGVVKRSETSADSEHKETEEEDHGGIPMYLKMHISAHAPDEIGKLHLLPSQEYGGVDQLQEDVARGMQLILQQHAVKQRQNASHKAAMPDARDAHAHHHGVFSDVVDAVLAQARLGKGKTKRSTLGGWQDLRIGMKWEEVGLEKPPTGTEITEPQLSSALRRGKMTFSRDEYACFKIKGLSNNSHVQLSYDCYIQAGDHYFGPAEDPNCNLDILNDIHETEESEDRIQVVLRQPIEFKANTERLWVRKLEVFHNGKLLEEELPHGDHPPMENLPPASASWRVKVSKVTNALSSPKKVFSVSVGEEDWSWWRQALNHKAMNTLYMQRVAQLLNTPYASDLDPWICDGGYLDELHSQLTRAHNIKFSRPHHLSRAISMGSNQLSRALSMASKEPEGRENSTPDFAALADLQLQKTLQDNWNKEDRKNLEYFLQNRHRVQCTLRFCCRTNPWPVRGTLHPGPKDAESHADMDLQHTDYSECVYCKGAGGNDGGLFSGETLLHIAIVQHNLESIEWLLNHGAHLDDRALGIFFQPEHVKKIYHPMSIRSVKNVLSTLHQHEMMLFGGDTGEANQFFSGCNYGEYPLSFASAVGDDHVCHLLIQTHTARIKTMMRDITSTSSTFLNSETQAEKSRVKVHVNARGQKMPQYPRRFDVPDHSVPWSKCFPAYKPVEYEHSTEVVAWNDVDRLSFEYQGPMKMDDGSYNTIKGAPLNPHGRTGIKGRGLLKKWGPNHTAHPIVTRFDPVTTKLQVMVVNHEDTLTCHTWALPGSSVDPGKDISETVWEAFETEAGSLQNEDDKQNFQSLMGELFDDGKVVYRGYVDDPRNTDNAWIETSAVHFGCNALLGDMLTLKAVNVKWLDVVLDEEEYKNMYDGHRGWVDDVARSFERAARQLTGNWDATVTHSARKDFFREMHEWTKANVLDGGGGRGSSSIAMYEQVLKSVFINRRDSNGNTALHLAVMKKQTSTVDFLIEHGAAPSLNILNNDNLTPLTMAARIGDVKIMNHLINKSKETIWAYGTVAMTKTSLEQIDTFRMNPTEYRKTTREQMNHLVQDRRGQDEGPPAKATGFDDVRQLLDKHFDRLMEGCKEDYKKDFKRKILFDGQSDYPQELMLAVAFQTKNSGDPETEAAKALKSHVEREKVNFIHKGINKHPLVLLALKAGQNTTHQSSMRPEETSAGRRVTPDAVQERGVACAFAPRQSVKALLVGHKGHLFEREVDVDANQLFVVVSTETATDDDVREIMQQYASRGELLECYVVTATGMKGHNADNPKCTCWGSRKSAGANGPDLSPKAKCLVGSMWINIGSKKPRKGSEIKNRELATALREKTEFSQQELNAFNVHDLSYDSYIKIKYPFKRYSTYLKPAVCPVRGTHKGCAFVKFSDPEDANDAVRALNPTESSSGWSWLSWPWRSRGSWLTVKSIKWVCREQALEDGFVRQPHVAIGRTDYEHVHQDPTWRSALEVVVQHEIQAFHFGGDEWSEHYFEDLVKEKWESFARRVHIIWRLLPFGAGTLFYMFFISARICAVWPMLVAEPEVVEQESDSCSLLLEMAGDPNQIQMVLGPIFFATFIPLLLYWGNQEKRLNATDIDPNEDHDISFKEFVMCGFKNLGAILNLAISLCLIVHAVHVIERYSSNDFRSLAPQPTGADATVEISLCDDWCRESMAMTFASLFMFCKLLHLLLPFQLIGVVLISIWRMFIGDVAKWLMVYVFLWIGFGVSTYIVVLSAYAQDPHSEPFASGGPPAQFSNYIILYFYVALGEVSGWEEYSEPYNSLVMALHIVYILMSTLLMLNLIIAMMGDTWSEDREKGGLMMWWMNHASVVLQYERALPTKKRKMYRSGADLTPELPHLEKRAFYNLKVAQDKALQESWQEKQVSNRDVHSAILDFRKDQRQEEDMNKRLFRRLDAKLNSIFKKLDHTPGEGGGGHRNGRGGGGVGDGGGSGGGHEDEERGEGAGIRSGFHAGSVLQSAASRATRPHDGAQTDNQQQIADTPSMTTAEVLIPGGVPDSPTPSGDASITASSPAQPSQTQSSPARGSRLKRLPPLAPSGWL